jgi:flavin reductase (DIM6/NTAB) family NADH-FMN oxidoreductase RutF
MPPSLSRDLLVLFPSGVTVVTARDSDQADHGMTVSAFVPVSVEPALVLICIAQRTRMHRVLSCATYFGVNVLGTDATDVARRFSSVAADRFAGVEVERGASGVPLLRDAVAHLECRMERRYWGGDHSIFMGEVVDGRMYGGEPLVYVSHTFGRLEPGPQSRPALSIEGLAIALAGMEPQDG